MANPPRARYLVQLDSPTTPLPKQWPPVISIPYDLRDSADVIFHDTGFLTRQFPWWEEARLMVRTKTGYETAATHTRDLSITTTHADPEPRAW